LTQNFPPGKNVFIFAGKPVCYSTLTLGNREVMPEDRSASGEKNKKLKSKRGLTTKHAKCAKN